MMPNEIFVGKTYCNRGRGLTSRTVLEISRDLECKWYSECPPPDEPVVRYDQDGHEGRLYLRSFASWCGKEVTR